MAYSETVSGRTVNKKCSVSETHTVLRSSYTAVKKVMQMMKTTIKIITSHICCHIIKQHTLPAYVITHCNSYNAPGWWTFNNTTLFRKYIHGGRQLHTLDIQGWL